MNIATVNMKQVALCFEGDPPVATKKVHPVESQAMLDHITARAAEKGMVVNDKKTGPVMCVGIQLVQSECVLDGVVWKSNM